MGLRETTQRAAFMARLILRVASRALPQRSSAPKPVEAYDPETVIEALQTGDVAALEAQGAGLATARDAQGNPWFFIALETGSLEAICWFLSQGASATAPDRAGRLPLEAVIERAGLGDEFDDHLEDCPAMAAALLANGADPAARTLRGESLTELAKAAGLDLSPP